jgi:malto-oligosyltrehalose trehalohydrolase
MTGEGEGYYLDYANEPLALLGRVLAEGFAYQGEASVHRDGAKRGEPSGDLPPTAFVSFLQNHDQIGNRAFGERIEALADPEALRAFHAILLLAPQIPMLFMGEEWGSRRPFLFFCDFAEPLASAVRNGRRKEFERFPEFRNPATRDRIPDPTTLETFMHSRIDWSERSAAPNRSTFNLMRELIAIRRSFIVPHLAGTRHGGDWQLAKDGLLQVRWPLGDGIELAMVANLTDVPAKGANWRLGGRRIFSLPGVFPDEGAELAPWSVCFALRDRGAA